MATTGLLAIGYFHSCAARPGGRLRCWGYNILGQLGLGITGNVGDQPGEMGVGLASVDLGGGAALVAISASGGHTCGQLADGRLKCWGENGFGQLGLEDDRHRGGSPLDMGNALPAVELGGSARVVSVAAGDQHTCAALESGQVKCWGRNFLGQLGLGDVVHRGGKVGQMGDALPSVDLGAGARVVAVTAGFDHTCALLEGGRVKCWGDNEYGQLGLGDHGNHRGDEPGEMGDALPFVDLGTNARAIALHAGHDYTCALLDGGRLTCWGTSVRGVLGQGDTRTRGGEPGEMGDALPALDLGTGLEVASLATGESHACAVFTSGQLKCWGDGFSGQLGQGDTAHRGDEPGEMGDALPFVDLGADARVRAVVCGPLYSCAWLEGGAVKCWGNNSYGALGLGDLAWRGDSPDEMGDALPTVDLGLP